MKLLAVTALALCMTVAIGCAEGGAPTPETEAIIANASNKVQANIEGMECTGCSGGVEAALSQIAGVTAASADHATGDVTVALADDADAEATKAEIETVLTGLSDGKYTVKTIAVSTAAEGDADAEGEAEEAADTETDESAAAEEAGTVYTVSGMTCETCSGKVTEALTAVEGVESAYVCHKSGKATLTAAEGAEICPHKVAAAVEAAGFKVAESCEAGSCDEEGCEAGTCDKEGCEGGTCEKDGHEMSAEEVEGTVYTITGMTCEKCSAKLTEALTAIDCVGSAHVCHKSGKATLTTAEGHPYVCPGKVAAAVQAAGFELATDAE